MPVGVLLAAIGVAGMGVTTTFPMTALAVGIGGIGIADRSIRSIIWLTSVPVRDRVDWPALEEAA